MSRRASCVSLVQQFFSGTSSLFWRRWASGVYQTVLPGFLPPILSSSSWRILITFSPCGTRSSLKIEAFTPGSLRDRRGSRASQEIWQGHSNPQQCCYDAVAMAPHSDGREWTQGFDCGGSTFFAAWTISSNKGLFSCLYPAGLGNPAFSSDVNIVPLVCRDFDNIRHNQRHIFGWFLWIWSQAVCIFSTRGRLSPRELRVFRLSVRALSSYHWIRAFSY